MNVYEAACPHCGQVHSIQSYAYLDEANQQRKAAAECGCDGALTASAVERARSIIPNMFDGCRDGNGNPVEAGGLIMELMLQISALVANGNLDKATIQINKEDAAKFTPKDRVTVTRVRKRQISQSI